MTAILRTDTRSQRSVFTAVSEVFAGFDEIQAVCCLNIDIYRELRNFIIIICDKDNALYVQLVAGILVLILSRASTSICF